MARLKHLEVHNVKMLRGPDFSWQYFVHDRQKSQETESLIKNH